jgi:crotonobetainyl-CoA:carnitine CoA-transferase CaiB-like acyl-CoA transferase
VPPCDAQKLISIVEPLFWILGPQPSVYDQLGIVPNRSGNRWDISAPRNTYQTADGRWLAMSGSAPAAATRIFEAIGRADVDFGNPQGRLARAEEVDQVVADWVAERTLAEAMAVFEVHQAAAAPIYTVTDLIADEQLAHRGVFVNVPDDELGSMTVQAPVPRCSDDPGEISHLGPRCGQHTGEIFQKLLGLTANEIDDLRERGVV